MGETGQVRIAFGTDELNETTERAVGWLREHGHEVDVVATAPWTDVGRDVGRAVADGRADRGVVACWTGTGVSIAANKVPGVRAALCTDAATAAGARTWNDANVLAFGLRLTTPALVEELLDAFVSTDVAEGEHLTIARLPD